MADNFHFFLDFLSDFEPINVIIVMLCAGVSLGYFAYRLNRSVVIGRAESLAETRLEEINDKAELLMLDTKESVQEMETELWSRDEKAMLLTEEHIEELEEIYKEKKKRADDQYSVERQKALEQESNLKGHEKIVADADLKLQEKRQQGHEAINKYIESLCLKANLSREVSRSEVIRTIEIDVEKRALAVAAQIEEDMKEHAELRAKEILALVLDRFNRPYCAERGLPAVYFETPEQRKIIFDEKGENVKALVETTGCDVVTEEG